ncbi:hypothetical protein E8E12_004357 [Didymella heteroderae]|uniref:Uncharacterized protein n=1 Tax=Didymella heteroderae TaxID=1769908 RepID=A0A9P4WLP0_9PLEO|nr:hypothetical protein E8E12_004357 [Didymella heteroderae]
MPASTRASTGNSKPRLVQQIENAVAPKKRTTTTANTSRPRTTGGRVAKPKTTATLTGPRTKVVKKRRTPTEKAKDKVVGTAEKLVGEVEEHLPTTQEGFKSLAKPHAVDFANIEDR